MTPKQFKEEAQKLYDKHEGYAGEDGHIEVDALLSDCLQQLGYNEGLDILWFMEDFWYA